MVELDYAPITLRKVHVLEERVEELYTAMHLTLIIIFVALMYALYIVRDDIIASLKDH